eukprot:TRINITY_DN7298_c0_g1_i1.p1 TRINITY_DN7298_c0_g1~~TRINITY_DN7298_c0_g1_i1.p1  ORF type:complete len:429 (-),score=102.75 TRINITY_DN7298_c0_g1_i1:48-1334(-)
MSAPPAPPAPPPPPIVTRSAAMPIASLTALLSSSALSSGDVGSTQSAQARGNPRDAASAAGPAKYTPPPKKETNLFLAELQSRLGTPSQATQSTSSNPSLSRPGYRAPSGLPENGGTQGHDMVHYSISGPETVKVQTMAEYTLYCRDDDKKLIDVPISILDADIVQDKENGDESRGTVSSTGEKGVFLITFRARFVGNYKLMLYVKGQLEKRPIYPGGLPLKVTPDDQLVKKQLFFTVLGHGTYGGFVGKKVTFDILVKDQDDTPTDIDHQRLAVFVSQGMKKDKGDVDKESVGKYVGSYKPFGPGELILLVKYGEQEVIQTTVMITSGVEAAKCEVIDAPTGVAVNSPCVFKIQTKDSDGVNIPVGGEKFELGVSGPKGGTSGLVVRDELDGTYSVKFTLTIAGDYSFFLTLNKVSVGASPIKIQAQ